MARPRKPTSAKIRDGTLRADRMLNEPEPESTRKVPAPPARVTGFAAQLWRRLAPRLHREGLLTKFDSETLARYCLAEALVQRAYDALEEQGWVVDTVGGPKRNPWTTTLEKAMAEARQLSDRLGLSPSARGRLDVEPPKRPGEENAEEEPHQKGKRLRAEAQRRAAARRASARATSG